MGVLCCDSDRGTPELSACSGRHDNAKCVGESYPLQRDAEFRPVSIPVGSNSRQVDKEDAEEEGMADMGDRLYGNTSCVEVRRWLRNDIRSFYLNGE